MLQQIVRKMIAIRETANVPMGEAYETDNLLRELERANQILDKNLDKYSGDIPVFYNRSAAERASVSYDAPFFLNLPLSLASITVLVQECITALKPFNIDPPQAWIDLSNGVYDFSEYDPNMEDEEEVVPENFRMVAPL